MRFKNVLRNSFFSVLAQLVLILLGFVSSRVLNHQLGEALVGVNGVIANVLGILSVTELGFSTAVVYHLYRVLEAKDEKKIAALMDLYRRAYQIIAMTILGLGLCLLPVIHLFMKKNPFSLRYIRIIYVLWLLRTVTNYLLSYRRSILIADQREYIVSIMTLAANILNYSAIAFIVYFTKNYVLALGLTIVFETALSLILNGYVDKKYAYLRRYRKKRIDAIAKKRVFDDMKNIFFSKLSIKVLTSTDNLVISGMIGVVVNGLYNNYCMISTSVINLVMAVSNSIQPTMANLFLEKDTKKNYDVFRQISFLFFLISAFVVSSLASLMTPFVRELWLGERYILDNFTMGFIVVSAAVTIMGCPLSIVMAVSGMFRVERNLSIAASLSNILLSVLLAKPLGVRGVIFGTIFSHVLCILVRMWFFFRNYLKISFLTYAAEMLSYMTFIIGEGILTFFIVNRIYIPGKLWSFFLSCLVCVLLPNGLNLLVFFRSWRFQSVLRMVLHRK